MNKIRFADINDIDLLSQYDRHISKEELGNSIKLGRIYIAEDNGTFCGWLRYNLFWDNTPFMNMLFILPEKRGREIGKEMVLHWEQQMKESGYNIVMTSTQENESAKYFYEKLGYTGIGGFQPAGESYELIMTKQI